MDEYEVKYNKRIKLEHSYARDEGNVASTTAAGDEDPLKIYPEDIDGIKKEPEEEEETIIIKSEPDENEHAEKTLMEVVASEPCESAESNFFLTYTLPVNCELEVEDKGMSADPVARHVFQELQRMYECAMDDVKSLNKKLSAEKQKRTSRSSKSANNIRTLKSDIKKLKDQLNVTKSQEQALKRVLDVKSHEHGEQKKTNYALKSQLESLVKLNKDRNVCISDLRQQLQKKDDTIKSLKLTLKQQTKSLNQKRKDSEDSARKLKEDNTVKEAQMKEMDLRCALLTQKLATTNTKLALQKKELEKLKLDMEIMDKSIIDSLKTRQSLKDQVTHIEKDLREIKDNPALALRLQEAQKSCKEANQRLDEVRKQHLSEKKTLTALMKEKSQLVREHTTKTKDVEAKNIVLQQTMAVLKKSLDQKVEQCRSLDEECTKARQEASQMERALAKMEAEAKEKEKEFQARQCEYCGF